MTIPMTSCLLGGLMMMNVTSSKLPRKSSVNFVYLGKRSKNAQKRSYGLQTTLAQSSECSV